MKMYLISISLPALILYFLVSFGISATEMSPGTLFEYVPQSTLVDTKDKTANHSFGQIPEVYKQIDITKSHEVLVSFTSGTSSEKKQAAEKMENNLGDYNPAALYGLSLYYIMTDNERSALIYEFAVVRLLIDVNCAMNNDPNVNNAIGMIDSEFKSRAQFTDESYRKFVKIANGSTDKAINLDESLGRNYDRRWIYLYGEQLLINLYTKSKLDDKIISVCDNDFLKQIIENTYKLVRENKLAVPK